MDGTVFTCPSGFSSDDNLSAAMQECLVNKTISRVFAAMGERRANKISIKWGGFIDPIPFLSSNVQATNLPPHQYRPSKQYSLPDTAR